MRNIKLTKVISFQNKRTLHSIQSHKIKHIQTLQYPKFKGNWRMYFRKMNEWKDPIREM